MTEFQKMYRVRIDTICGTTRNFIVRDKADIDELVLMVPRYGAKVAGWSIDHTLSANDVLNELVMAEIGC